MSNFNINHIRLKNERRFSTINVQFLDKADEFHPLAEAYIIHVLNFTTMCPWAEANVGLIRLTQFVYIKRQSGVYTFALTDRLLCRITEIAALYW